VRARPIGDGDTTITVDTFAIADDGLHVALPPAAGGVRRDAVLTVCAKDKVYTFDVNTNQCTEWDAAMSARAESPGDECYVAKGAFDSFVINPFGGGAAMRMEMRDEALLSPALAAEVAEPAPTFKEAVRRVEERVKR
jgi:hypothetical protein